MVFLTVKRGEEPQFLFETNTSTPMAEIIAEISQVYNDRLRIDRLCMAIEQLAAHGITKPPKMQGLTPDQVVELKLKDESDVYYPSGGSVASPDDIGLRVGQAPNAQMQEVLKKTVSEAKAAMSKDQVKRNVVLTKQIIQDVLDKLRGAVMIVYPMGLPPYEEVQTIIDNVEDLAGKQAFKMVIPEDEMQLWWANKELQRGKLLSDFIGRNEKTKIVCKIQKRGSGAPVREPLYDEETQKKMMAYAYKKQEEWKKLEEAEDEEYRNSPWANSSALKSQLHGTSNIRW
jgi:hypothetical protein